MATGKTPLFEAVSIIYENDCGVHLSYTPGTNILDEKDLFLQKDNISYRVIIEIYIVSTFTFYK